MCLGQYLTSSKAPAHSQGPFVCANKGTIAYFLHSQKWTASQCNWSRVGVIWTLWLALNNNLSSCVFELIEVSMAFSKTLTEKVSPAQWSCSIILLSRVLWWIRSWFPPALNPSRRRRSLKAKVRSDIYNVLNAVSAIWSGARIAQAMSKVFLPQRLKNVACLILGLVTSFIYR